MIGLRVHTQENLNASNTNSASFDVFQDSSGITNFATCQRDTLRRVCGISSRKFSSQNMNYNSASPKAKIKTNNILGTNGQYFEIDNDGDSSYNVTKWLFRH